MRTHEFQVYEPKSIIIRSIKPNYRESTDRYWFGGNPFITHFINTLSFQFPSGEEQFVKSVNHFKNQVTDKELRSQIKGFIGQESLHSKVHDDFNKWVISLVPDAERYCQAIAKRHREENQKMIDRDPLLALSVTVGFEHMTAIMAGGLLRRPKTMQNMAPEVRALMIWHAIEEIEHKSVAFDVYKTMGGRYFKRVLGMLIATLSLLITTSIVTFLLLKKDKELTNFRALLTGLNELFGFKGYLTTLTLKYLSYFRPGFHPSQEDDSELLKQGHAALLKLTPVHVNGRLVNNEPPLTKEA